jgi:hypothetical protein
MAQAPFTKPLSVRAHFWLRTAGLLVVLAAQFGPRIVGSLSMSAGAATAATSGVALVAH